MGHLGKQFELAQIPKFGGFTHLDAPRPTFSFKHKTMEPFVGWLTAWTVEAYQNYKCPLAIARSFSPLKTERKQNAF
jgi:hypothetical protein